MNAIIISIGDELISGRTVDTNSAYLAGRLGEFGIFTLSHHTVGDEVDAVAKVTPADIQRVAAALLVPENRIVAHYLREEAP